MALAGPALVAFALFLIILTAVLIEQHLKQKDQT